MSIHHSTHIIAEPPITTNKQKLVETSVLVTQGPVYHQKLIALLQEYKFRVWR